jgi:predicted unusual protein kinase regulating ubiquinone biosynthesis (AarF/ABC1/UbiB family)
MLEIEQKISSCQYLIKEIIFIIKIFFIFISEIILYCFFDNYSSFIDRITHRLASVNILYVKLFQAIALNNNLIDDKINNKLLSFTDNAPWNYSDINFNDIIQVVNDYNLCLEDGFENPMNSGMISLVFKAYDKQTNVPMIIKIKRNNIDIKLKDAINNLKTILFIISFIPLFNKFQLEETLIRNIEIIQNQTNFQQEINNMIQMKDNCKHLKYIKIPTPNKEVTEKYSNIILMDYIDGFKINEIIEEDYLIFAKQVIKFGFVTSLIHGFSHGDLHAGNILFIKDKKDEKYPYKIGIIDFGIVYNINTEFKNTIFELITEIFTKSPLVTAERLLNSGIIEPKYLKVYLPREYYNNILNYTSELIDETMTNSKLVNQIQIYKFLYNFKECIINKPEIANLGLKLSDNFVKTQLVLTMTHGVTLSLCKDDFISIADNVLNELFHTNMIIE